MLELCARYFFEGGRDGGKKVRPTMVLLLSLAANHHQAATTLAAQKSVGSAAAPLKAAAAAASTSHGDGSGAVGCLSSQRRLAEITEVGPLSQDELGRRTPSFHSLMCLGCLHLFKKE